MRAKGQQTKKGGGAAEEAAATRGRLKSEGGGAGAAAGCKGKSSLENVENFLIKVDSCMSIGTKCWPSKGASFVGSSRYATISLAIEVAAPPPSLSSPLSLALCMHYGIRVRIRIRNGIRTGALRSFRMLLCLPFYHLLLPFVTLDLPRPASSRPPYLDSFNFCHLLHFNSPQRVMSFSTHPMQFRQGEECQGGRGTWGRGQFAFRRAAATFHSSNCAAQNKS